jgi:hypothetical protein
MDGTTTVMVGACAAAEAEKDRQEADVVRVVARSEGWTVADGLCCFCVERAGLLVRRARPRGVLLASLFSLFRTPLSPHPFSSPHAPGRRRHPPGRVDAGQDGRWCFCVCVEGEGE